MEDLGFMWFQSFSTFWSADLDHHREIRYRDTRPWHKYRRECGKAMSWVRCWFLWSWFPRRPVPPSVGRPFSVLLSQSIWSRPGSSFCLHRSATALKQSKIKVRVNLREKLSMRRVIFHFFPTFSQLLYAIPHVFLVFRLRLLLLIQSPLFPIDTDCAVTAASFDSTRFQLNSDSMTFSISQFFFKVSQ